MANNLYEIELPNNEILELRDKYAESHIEDSTSGIAGDPMFIKMSITPYGHVKSIESVSTNDIANLGFYTKRDVDTKFGDGSHVFDVESDTSFNDVSTAIENKHLPVYMSDSKKYIYVTTKCLAEKAHPVVPYRESAPTYISGQENNAPLLDVFPLYIGYLNKDAKALYPYTTTKNGTVKIFLVKVSDSDNTYGIFAYSKNTISFNLTTASLYNNYGWAWSTTPHSCETYDSTYKVYYSTIYSFKDEAGLGSNIPIYNTLDEGKASISLQTDSHIFYCIEGETIYFKALNEDGTWKEWHEDINNAVLPSVSAADNDKVLTVVNGQWDKADAPISLPEVTEEDNDKVLKVVEGEWSVAAESGGGSDLPQVTEEDNGKVLTVVEGEWTAEESSAAAEVIELTKDEYDALGDTVKTDGKLYFIKDWTQPHAMNGKGMASKVLWSGEKGTSGDILELSDKKSNYDLILFKAATVGANGIISGATISSIIQPSDAAAVLVNAESSGAIAYLDVKFNDDTSCKIGYVAYQGYIGIKMLQIIGLRFCAATCCHSTDEQIVGTWIDGKPIYQKTYTKEITSLNPFRITNDIVIGSIYNIKSVSGIIDTNENVFPVNSYLNSSWFSGCIIGDSGVDLYTGNSVHVGAIVEITIQYTKTTD